MKLAFLGAGNMAGAMIQSILAADVLKGDEILLVNARNPACGAAHGGCDCVCNEAAGLFCGGRDVSVVS